MNTLPLPLIGWPLLGVPDADGQLQFPDLERSVRQQIEVILRTARGEQLMRPEFGGGLTEFLHQPNTLNTKKRLQDRIAESIAQWESRVLVDRIDILDVPNAPSDVRVQIAYRLLRTGNAAEIGMTLSLENA